MGVENGGWRLNRRISIVYNYDILTLKFKETSFCRRAYVNKNKGSQAPQKCNSFYY